MMLPRQIRCLMTRKPRELRNLRMMESPSIRSLLLQMKVRLTDFNKIRTVTPLLESDDDWTTYLAMEKKPEKLRLAADISSSTSITISQKHHDRTLRGHKLNYRTGSNDTFITVKSGALTIEDSATPIDTTSLVDGDHPGQPAWHGMPATKLLLPTM